MAAPPPGGSARGNHDRVPAARAAGGGSAVRAGSTGGRRARPVGGTRRRRGPRGVPRRRRETPTGHHRPDGYSGRQDGRRRRGVALDGAAVVAHTPSSARADGWIGHSSSRMTTDQRVDVLRESADGLDLVRSAPEAPSRHHRHTGRRGRRGRTRARSSPPPARSCRFPTRGTRGRRPPGGGRGVPASAPRGASRRGRRAGVTVGWWKDCPGGREARRFRCVTQISSDAGWTPSRPSSNGRRTG